MSVGDLYVAWVLICFAVLLCLVCVLLARLWLPAYRRARRRQGAGAAHEEDAERPVLPATVLANSVVDSRVHSPGTFSAVLPDAETSPRSGQGAYQYNITINGTQVHVQQSNSAPVHITARGVSVSTGASSPDASSAPRHRHRVRRDDHVPESTATSGNASSNSVENSALRAGETYSSHYPLAIDLMRLGSTVVNPFLPASTPPTSATAHGAATAATATTASTITSPAPPRDAARRHRRSNSSTQRAGEHTGDAWHFITRDRRRPSAQQRRRSSSDAAAARQPSQPTHTRRRRRSLTDPALREMRPGWWTGTAATSTATGSTPSMRAPCTGKRSTLPARPESLTVGGADCPGAASSTSESSSVFSSWRRRRCRRGADGRVRAASSDSAVFSSFSDPDSYAGAYGGEKL